ncbi:MAG: heavy metal-binding domain-containing protein [Pyrinomonadaceae bacterium]
MNKFQVKIRQAFLEKKKQEEKSAAESQGVEYTCPMHPEILQIGPGTCPKCGMALEPKVLSFGRCARPGIR